MRGVDDNAFRPSATRCGSGSVKVPRVLAVGTESRCAGVYPAVTFFANGEAKSISFRRSVLRWFVSQGPGGTGRPRSNFQSMCSQRISSPP